MPSLLPDELANELKNVVPRLEAAGVLHALIGGAAVMAYGLRARTRHLDLLCWDRSNDEIVPTLRVSGSEGR